MINYPFFRKVHRVLVLVMTFSVLLMTITGILLKYPEIPFWLHIDPVFVRSLHNGASPFFTIVLLLMMISGLVMYFYPIWRSRKK